MPEGWEVKKIGDVVCDNNIETGKRPKGGAQDTGVPSIGAENVNGIAFYDFAKEKYVPEDFYNQMKQGKLQNRDILFYKDGAEIGRVALFQDEFPHSKCCVNEHVFLIRTDVPDYQYYLFFNLVRKTMFEYIQNINKNAAQPGINKNELKSIVLLWPNSIVINSFNQTITPLVQQIFKCSKKQKVIKQTRDRLLSRLMSGKIDLENLDIQFPKSMREETVAEPVYTELCRSAEAPKSMKEK